MDDVVLDDQGLAGFRLNTERRVAVTLGHQGERRTLADQIALADATGFADEKRVLVFDRGTAYDFDREARGTGHHSAHDGDILSPMPGKIIAVDVAQGDQVAAGQRLLVLEAMKMEHALTAPFDGTVTEVNASEGAQVQVEALLARIEQADD